MPPLSTIAIWWLTVSWIVFSGLLLWNHLRVRRERRRSGIAEEQPSIRDPRSMRGLALEGASFVVAFAFQRSAPAPAWMAGASMAFGLVGPVLLFAALRHLGLEWRIKAIVTERHELITSGPYAKLRHPVFTALLCLLLSTALLITDPWAALAAVAICLYGTEIRVRAEDGLLERRFGARFLDYKSRVRAYLPFAR